MTNRLSTATPPISRIGKRSNVAPMFGWWLDALLLFGSLGIFTVTGIWLIASGSLYVPVSGDLSHLSWYLVRSTGNVAYVLLAASMIWGLFLVIPTIRKRVLSNPSSLLLHSATSWGAILLSLTHALLLLLNSYYHYSLTDLFIPFTGPYRPFEVGLGIIAFWIILVVSISFNFRRFMGNRAWHWLHYTSYFAFAMVTFHSLKAGTDGERLGMQLLLGAGVASVMLLLVWRLGGKASNKGV